MAWEETAHRLRVGRHGLSQATEAGLAEAAEALHALIGSVTGAAVSAREVTLIRQELPALVALAAQLGCFLEVMRQLETHLCEGYGPQHQPAAAAPPTQIWEG